MTQKISVDVDGVVVPASNVPHLPRLQISATTRSGKRLVRLHRLLSGAAPHVCIKRGEGIGDLLMTTPIARFISEQYPNAIITYATNLSYLNGALPAVLQNNPHVQSVIDWDSICDSDYDVVLDLHCPCVAHEQPKAPPINRIDLFARHVGIARLPNPRPVYLSTPTEIEEAQTWLQRTTRPKCDDMFVMMNPFASNQQRSVDPLLMKDVIGTFRTRFPFVKLVVVTHTSDFTQDISWDTYAHAVAKNWPIRKVAALLSCCNLLICPDSALLHMAGALDVPTLALFGPTDARARVNLYPKACGVWPGMSLSCAPCWYNSHRCSHQTCWKMIRAQDIFDVAVKMLSLSKASLLMDGIVTSQQEISCKPQQVISSEVI